MSGPSTPGQGPPLPEAVWQAPPDLVGTVLAERYKITGVIGDGGMGRVYLAEQTTLRKKLAIKVLKHEYCRERTHVERFLQEARAASMIAHENIVSIIDFGPVPGGSVFFAMEFLDGRDLSSVIESQGRLPWPRARKIAIQVCRALTAAHSRGVIHRDLKPANCFVIRQSDGSDFVKLLDFGIAKVLDPDMQSADGLTRTGAVFGTAKYMAPEQASGERVDPRTDIYALGVMLYEMVTGNVPFPGVNFMQVLSRHLTEQPRPVREAAPDAGIPESVEAIVMKALAKRREDRFQTMEELETAIQQADPSLATRPPVARRPRDEAPTWPPSPSTATEPQTVPHAGQAVRRQTAPSHATVAAAPPRSSGVVPIVAAVAISAAGIAAAVQYRDSRNATAATEASSRAAQTQPTRVQVVEPPARPTPDPLPVPDPVPAAEPEAVPEVEPAPDPTPLAAEPARPAGTPDGAKRSGRGRRARKPTTKPATEPTAPTPKLKPLSPMKAKYSAADISAGLATVDGEVANCRDAHGGIKGSTVTVDFTINGDQGRVTRAVPLGSFKSTPLGKCVANAVKSAKFPEVSAERIRPETRKIKL